MKGPCIDFTNLNAEFTSTYSSVWISNGRSSPDYHMSDQCAIITWSSRDLYLFKTWQYGVRTCTFVPPDLSGFGSFCWKISLFFPTWWNKYYFTWKRSLQRVLYVHRCLQQKFMKNMFTVAVYCCFLSFLCLLLFMCGDVEKYPGPTESNIQDLLNQNGLKVFHQNVRGLFHNIGKLSTFLHTHKNIHIFSLSERRMDNSIPT